mmetsp:Transcript_27458/g.72142  ORF Transcript_27458/g.72142 Transcript_27458/m.72142 type:complete len:203 (-) Transcript_27458:4368-4976(-)
MCCASISLVAGLSRIALRFEPSWKRITSITRRFVRIRSALSDVSSSSGISKRLVSTSDISPSACSSSARTSASSGSPPRSASTTRRGSSSDGATLSMLAKNRWCVLCTSRGVMKMDGCDTIVTSENSLIPKCCSALTTRMASSKNVVNWILASFRNMFSSANSARSSKNCPDAANCNTRATEARFMRCDSLMGWSRRMSSTT